MIISLHVEAYFEPPKSWSNKKRNKMVGELHRTRPDCDNILKAGLDGLFREDKSIASCTIVKRWGESDELRVRIVYLEG
jgi:Holliday junction resolvase RusA-like endonuclease